MKKTIFIIVWLGFTGFAIALDYVFPALHISLVYDFLTDILVFFTAFSGGTYFAIELLKVKISKKDPLNMGNLNIDLLKDKNQQLEQKIKTLESALEKAIS